MYYPIIDKLKDVMEEIGQSGGGTSAFIIDGTFDYSTRHGTYTADILDIMNAIENKQPVYLYCEYLEDPSYESFKSYMFEPVILVKYESGEYFTASTPSYTLDDNGTFRTKS